MPDPIEFTDAERAECFRLARVYDIRAAQYLSDPLIAKALRYAATTQPASTSGPTKADLLTAIIVYGQSYGPGASCDEDGRLQDEAWVLVNYLVDALYAAREAERGCTGVPSSHCSQGEDATSGGSATADLSASALCTCPTNGRSTVCPVHFPAHPVYALPSLADTEAKHG